MKINRNRWNSFRRSLIYDPTAHRRLQKDINDFEILLVTEVETAAFARQDRIVQLSHVEPAAKAVYERQYRRQTRHELALLAGGILLGTFLSGFVNEVTAKAIDSSILLLYLMMGFAGTFLVTWGLKL